MKMTIFTSAILAISATTTFSIVENASAAGCPAFTTGMVDAAAMAARLESDWLGSIEASDEPNNQGIYCKLIGVPSAGGNTFEVDVNVSIPNTAYVWSHGVSEDDPDYDTGLSSSAEGLSRSEMNACRAEIIKSFVWNNYCAPRIPPFEN